MTCGIIIPEATVLTYDNTMEIWKTVERHGGKYEVSSRGRFRRKWAGNGGAFPAGRILKTRVDADGYPHAHFHIGYDPATQKTKSTSIRVHRLVAEAFLGESNGRQVNHINSVRSDNRLENLQWVTPKQNIRHSRYGMPEPVHVYLGLSEMG